MFDHAALVDYVSRSQAARRNQSRGSANGARLVGALHEYCARVTAACKAGLGDHDLVVRADLGCVQRYGERVFAGQVVVARIRVFQESLALIMPVEFVQHLLGAVLDREVSVALSEPSEAELAAVSFFLARTLACEALFGNQRVYLAGVDTLGGTNAKSIQERPGVLEIGLELRFDGSEYYALGVLESGLSRRIACYLGYRITGPGRLRLAAARVNWQVSLQELKLPAAALLNLIPGMRFNLTSSEETIWPCVIQRNAGGTSVNTTLVLGKRYGLCSFCIGGGTQ